MKNKKRNIISFRTKAEVILIAALFIGIAVSGVWGTVTMTDKTTTTDDSDLVINFEEGWVSAYNGSFLNWFDVGGSLNVTDTTMTTDNKYEFVGEYDWNNATIQHYAGESTYVVFKDGAITYCKSGDNGTIMFSDTDDVVVIQYALDQFNDDRGGSVKLKSCHYIINDAIYINYSGIDFSMESMWRGNSTLVYEGTGLFLADNVDKDMLMITGRKCHVHDLYMYGNKDNNIDSDGIETASDTALDLHLTDIYVMYFDEHGIHWRGGAGFADGVYSEYNDRNGFYVRGDRNVFTGCSSWADRETGFYITEDSNKFIGCTAADSIQNGFIIQDHDSYGTIINGCTVQRAGEHGIWIYGGINNIISNCVIEDPSNDNDNGYDGIYISTLAAEHSTHNQIIGNRIYNDAANDQKYCIEEADSNQDYNLITNNIVTDGQTGQILVSGGNTSCKDNIGYDYSNYLATPFGTTTPYSSNFAGATWLDKLNDILHIYDGSYDLLFYANDSVVTSDMMLGWNASNSTLIRNSNGNSWIVSAANLQTALDDVSGEPYWGNGAVWLPGNCTVNFYGATSLDIPDEVTLYGNGATLYMDSTTRDAITYLVKMGQRSQIYDVSIDARVGAYVYNHTIILIDGSEQTDPKANPITIGNVVIVGGDQTCTGFNFSSISSGSAINYVSLLNCKARSCLYAIKLNATGGTAGAGNMANVNGNNFDNFISVSNVYTVHISHENTSYSECAGNNFDNFQIQPDTVTDNTIDGVWNNGSSNKFTNFQFWDWSHASGYMFNLSSPARRTYISYSGGNYTTYVNGYDAGGVTKTTIMDIVESQLYIDTVIEY